MNELLAVYSLDLHENAISLASTFELANGKRLATLG